MADYCIPPCAVKLVFDTFTYSCIVLGSMGVLGSFYKMYNLFRDDTIKGRLKRKELSDEIAN